MLMGMVESKKKQLGKVALIAGCGLARSSLTDLFGILYALIRCGLSDRLGDDASHVLAPTIAIFEMLLPKLRPGGLFTIEDWPCKHLQEKTSMN
jgi:hypothetical protein